MTKRLIDVDDEALALARARLGATTIKDTVNMALRQVADDRRSELRDALDVLAAQGIDDRSASWR